MVNKIKVAVSGAGGKMGTRTSTNLAAHPESIDLRLVENSSAGVASIAARGLAVMDVAQALNRVDVTVLAVPDKLIQVVSGQITPLLPAGSALIILDPAAAVARELCLRDDCTFVVTHPCHPSYFLDQDTEKARHDYFGGAGGRQDIVMAQIQGEATAFAQARRVSELMFEPVEHSYIMDVRQIAFLEPTLVELLGATCLRAMADTVAEAERRGIERAAAVSFLAGHIYNLSANFLGYLGNVKVSDACQVAIGLGERLVLRDDWKRIWQDEVLDKVIATMLHPDEPAI
jgi:hypothetical protein